MDAANLLKQKLARGQLRCIGATATDEYCQQFETNAAFEWRFQQVTVAEPSVSGTISESNQSNLQSCQIKGWLWFPQSLFAQGRKSICVSKIELRMYSLDRPPVDMLDFQTPPGLNSFKTSQSCKARGKISWLFLVGGYYSVAQVVILPQFCLLISYYSIVTLLLLYCNTKRVSEVDEFWGHVDTMSGDSVQNLVQCPAIQIWWDLFFSLN